MKDKDTDKEHASWNEAALAELVGLEEKVRETGANSSVTEVSDTANVIEMADLFEAQVKSDPRENTTTRTLAKKPLPKLAVVAVGLLAVFGLGGLVLSSMMKVKVPTAATKLASTTADKNKTSVVEKKDEDSSEGQLKTQLAIASQASELKEIDEKSKAKKKKGAKPEDKPEAKTRITTTSAPVTTQPTSSSSYRSSPPPPPPPTTYLPAPVRVAPPPPPPTPKSENPVGVTRALPAPVPVPSPPPSPSPLNQQQVLSPDSIEQWHRLAMLGSYGRVGEEVEVKDDNRATTGTGEQAGKQEPRLGTHEATVLQPTPVKMVSTQLALNEDEDEQRVLLGIAVKRLAPASSAAATLSTSLVWSDEADGDRGKTDQRFVVALTEPLLDVDGNEAIATGQQIVFNVTAIDSNGLVTAEAISLIDEQGTERTLPPGVVTCMSNQGKPLVAKGLFDSGSQIASMDLGIAGLGAVAKIGEILNRPKQQQQQSVSGGQISTSSTSTTGDPNLLGALMEGAATPVLESIQERNQAAIEKLLSQKNAWFLPVGHSVQVIVTRAFDL